LLVADLIRNEAVVFKVIGHSRSELCGLYKQKKSVLEGFLLYYSWDVPFEGWYISVSGGRLVKKPRKGSGRLIHRRCHKNMVIQCPTDSSEFYNCIDEFYLMYFISA
jgi:hypothetical protein